MRFILSAAGSNVEKYVEKLSEAGFAVSELDDDSIDLDNPYRKMRVDVGSIKELVRLSRVIGQDLIVRTQYPADGVPVITIYDDCME